MKTDKFVLGPFHYDPGPFNLLGCALGPRGVIRLEWTNWARNEVYSA